MPFMNESIMLEICQKVLAETCRKLGYEATDKMALMALVDVFRLCRTEEFDYSIGGDPQFLMMLFVLSS
jgi:hypothetical protein